MISYSCTYKDIFLRNEDNRDAGVAPIKAKEIENKIKMV